MGSHPQVAGGTASKIKGSVQEISEDMAELKTCGGDEGRDLEGEEGKVFEKEVEYKNMTQPTPNEELHVEDGQGEATGENIKKSPNFKEKITEMIGTKEETDKQEDSPLAKAQVLQDKNEQHEEANSMPPDVQTDQNKEDNDQDNKKVESDSQEKEVLTRDNPGEENVYKDNEVISGKDKKEDIIDEEEGKIPTFVKKDKEKEMSENDEKEKTENEDEDDISEGDIKEENDNEEKELIQSCGIGELADPNTYDNFEKEKDDEKTLSDADLPKDVGLKKDDTEDKHRDLDKNKVA